VSANSIEKKMSINNSGGNSSIISSSSEFTLGYKPLNKHTYTYWHNSLYAPSSNDAAAEAPQPFAADNNNGMMTMVVAAQKFLQQYNSQHVNAIASVAPPLLHPFPSAAQAAATSPTAAVAINNEQQQQEQQQFKLLDGVPILLKDVFLTENWPSSCGGVKEFSEYKARKDAPIVQLLKKHGAIPIAKTRVPLLCLGMAVLFICLVFLFLCSFFFLKNNFAHNLKLSFIFIDTIYCCKNHYHFRYSNI